MELPDNCKEIFLDGITEVTLYPVQGASLPVPFNVARILQMEDCSFADAVMQVTIAGEGYITATDITTKVTQNMTGGRVMYGIETSINVDAGSNNVREACKALGDEDYYMVLKRIDGTIFLCYTLPNTFAINAPQTINGSSEQRQIAISVKALSEPIPIGM